VDILAGEYDVDRDALERDVLAFATDLADGGMLELVAPAEEDRHGL
jgi:Coenzyme PQQ synthesis protein D (PqqD)